MRVLVVDDHEVFRNVLGSVLDAEGYELADAPDADAALACVAGFDPDVVVIDAEMPGMSDIEATRGVLRLASEAAVVISSLFEDEEMLGRVARTGAVAHLRKHARLDEIVSVIEAAARIGGAGSRITA